MFDAPTLFDLPPAEPSARAMRPGPTRVRVRRPKPQPLAPGDDHPGAEARFDVLFTHEQMMTLNAACLTFYERCGLRVNKSQIVRALVASLRQAQGGVGRELARRQSTMPAKAPPKAAAADVHRRFEAALADVLTHSIRAADDGR